MLLEKNYLSSAVEEKISKVWTELELFRANPNSQAAPFSLVMPPPNVTGVLHMGHALVSTLQDVLVRWKRMMGYETLWVPGTDHAGIATQTLIEKRLIKTQGKSRKDFSREEFIKIVWQWKTKSERTIIQQLKALGCSCDWSRQRFTMDEGNNKAVRKAFKKLFDQGLIYRGDYVVNWDPQTQTALADDEVEYKQQQGYLWYLRYPLADGTGDVIVATTRPETLLGDVAIAVSPKDPRYSSLIGKEAILPILGKKIPILADHFVDPSFGTGMVKITPAHDINDYQVALRHNLPMINIMTPDGKINEKGAPFTGLSMREAREAIVKQMDQEGFLVKIEKHEQRIGFSYRSKAIIEPYLSKQWFIKMGDVLKESLDADELALCPDNWKKSYSHWISSLRDWCISRQLWWGHRIPVWYHKKSDRMLCSETNEPPEEVQAHPEDWKQDEDVLDTWFSAALWPFSALGWPEKTPELDRFYPNSILITGHDILFFWVARMVFMGKLCTGKLPFPKVFLHGLIYGKSYWKEEKGQIFYLDREQQEILEQKESLPAGVFSQWEKMSKSKGNVINPLEMIEAYGADAVRMTLCSSPSQLRQIDLDRRRFEDFKHFSNKLWNAARFVFLQLEEPLTLAPLQADQLRIEDHWILLRASHCSQEMQKALDRLSLDDAAKAACDFLWKDFCAHYLESLKSRLPQSRQLLCLLFCQAIRFLHPFAPFITEELFQKLKERIQFPSSDILLDAHSQELQKALQAPACAVAAFPRSLPSFIDKNLEKEVEKNFSFLQDFLLKIRQIRGEMRIPPQQKVTLIIKGPQATWLKKEEALLKAFVKIESIIVDTKLPKEAFGSTIELDGLSAFVPLPAELLQREKERIQKELIALQTSIDKQQASLQNPQFLSRAPAKLVQEKRDKLAQQKKQYEQLSQKL